MFSISGAHLTLRIRKLAFESMLKQEMGWYDDPKNKTGALCAWLSSDASKIQGVSALMHMHINNSLRLFNTGNFFLFSLPNRPRVVGLGPSFKVSSP